MTTRYDLTARIIDAKPIAQFELAEGEDLDTRVIEEIGKAFEEGTLGRLETRVGLPPISVKGVEDGENLSGGENVTVQRLYAPDGEPLSERDYRTSDLGKGVALIGTIEGAKDMPIGVLATQALADIVGTFWRNGHIGPQDGAPTT